MVPSETDAKPQAATAEEIDLGRLLRNDAGLALRRNEDAAREPDVFGDRCQETQRHKGLVEGSLLVVERNPAVPRRRAKDVIGHLDIGVAEIFGCLRPVADLRGIAANVEAREEGIELHGWLQLRAAMHL
jgi:hypothetical protein